MEAILRGVKQCCHDMLQKQTDASSYGRKWETSDSRAGDLPGSQGSFGLLFWARFISVARIFKTYHFILTKCVMLGNPHFWDVTPLLGL